MKRVMVVDDEEQIVSVLKEFLTARGYDVLTATDGLKAIKMMKGERPLVVLLDIVMPGMNGIETLIEIKKLYPHIEVVIMSALSDSERVKKALQLGAYDYVIKPFDLNYIETVIVSKIVELTSSN